MRAMLWLPRTAWRVTHRLFVLVRDDQDVRDIYGDNPNGIPEDERLFSAGLTSNIAMNSYGM